MSDSITSFNRDPEEFAGDNDRNQDKRSAGCCGTFFEHGRFLAAASGSRLNGVTSSLTVNYMDCIAESGVFHVDTLNQVRKR